MTVNSHLWVQAYESQRVNLPDSTREDLYAKREANRNRLRQKLPDDIKIREFIAQGSMAIRTTVQETGCDYDIDDGVVFYASTLKGRIIGLFDMSSDEVREMVVEALRDEKFSRQPEIIGNCIRVFYAEGYHVDVPVFRCCYPDTPDERQELAGKDGWIESNPTQINSWFEGRVQDLNRLQEGAGSQLRRMIRLLKRFARSRGEKWNMPNGLKLTMLAEECFERSAERDDKAFYFLLEKLNSRLRASLGVRNRAQQESPSDELTRSDSDDNMIELREHVEETLNKMSVLWDTKCSESQARQVWEWVFQADGFFRSC